MQASNMPVKIDAQYESTTSKDFRDISDVLHTVPRVGRNPSFDVAVRESAFGCQKSTTSTRLEKLDGDLFGEGITYWSENQRKGVLPHGQTANTNKAPFHKDTKFSTPIQERLF